MRPTARDTALRVMMLTPDTAIDRRILQEAATLTESWAEVLVVAMQPSDSPYPQFELAGETKVRRFRFDGTDPRVLPWVPVRDGIARWVHALVSRLQRALDGAAPGPRAVPAAENGGRRGWLARAGARVERLGRDASATLAPLLGDSHLARRRGRRALLLPARLNACALIALGVSLGYLGRLLCLPRRPALSAPAARAAQRSLDRVLPAFLGSFQYFLRLWSRGCSRMTGLTPFEYALYRELRTYPYDVYHAHDLPMLKVARRLAQRWRAKLVYDAHELYPEIVTLTPEQRQSYANLERRNIRRADLVITVNHFIADEMARRYRVPTPEVILNCANLLPSDFERSPRFHERLGLGPECLVVLYQGWLAPHRGLEGLVRAAHDVPPAVAVVLLGFGDYWSDLERLIADEGLGERVFLVPAVPQSELLEWTAAADIGIIPYQPVDINTRFCSPNKLFEYIAAGIPVIGNDLPFLREMIVGQGLGIVHPLSTSHSYAEAIARLAGSAEEREGCRANVARAAKALNWEAEGAKLLGLYRRLMGEGVATGC